MCVMLPASAVLGDGYRIMTTLHSACQFGTGLFGENVSYQSAQQHKCPSTTSAAVDKAGNIKAQP